MAIELLQFGLITLWRCSW